MSENSASGSMDFKGIVHEWISLHDEIKNVQGMVRQKRNRMNQLQTHIVRFMQENEKEICTVGENNALVIKSRKSTSGIKKDDVMRLLKGYMSDDKAKERTDELYNGRETKLKTIVHLTNIR